MKLRAWLLIASYVILVGLVVAETFWFSREFDQNHDDQCQIAYAQVTVTGLDLVAGLGVRDPDPDTVAAINDAIARLNDTCGFDLEPVD